MGNSIDMKTWNDDKAVIKEGYLEKESVHLKQLRKRWIVLKGNKLFSFKQETADRKPTEIIDLSLCKNVEISNNSNKFTLIFQDKKRIFIALSTNDMNEWVKYIKHIIHCTMYTHHTQSLQTYSIHKFDVTKTQQVLSCHMDAYLVMIIIGFCVVPNIFDFQQRMDSILIEVELSKYSFISLKIRPFCTMDIEYHQVSNPGPAGDLYSSSQNRTGIAFTVKYEHVNNDNDNDNDQQDYICIVIDNTYKSKISSLKNINTKHLMKYKFAFQTILDFVDTRCGKYEYKVNDHITMNFTINYLCFNNGLFELDINPYKYCN